MKMSGRVTVSPGRLAFDGDVCAFGGLNELYRRRVGDYPKFFKMDGLCKLGFLAAEFLLKDIPADVKEDAAIILFNRSGSLAADRNYQRTIGDVDYFPSPALFVYTLANIVTGEIAIRHKILGESSFYILDNKDDEEMAAIVDGTFHTSNPPMVIAGWVEYENDSEYLADMWIAENQQQNRYSKNG